MATCSSVLVWKIPWTEEPGELCPWSCKESVMTEQLNTHTHTHTHTHTVPLKLVNLTREYRPTEDSYLR